jgi:hypothetical protein
MSPQMNGDEPADRDERQTVIPSRARAQPSEQIAPPLPPALDTSGVRSRTVRVGDELAPLFSEQALGDFRSRWDSVQRSFVDDPKQAVQLADELVAEVTQSLTESFKGQRARFDGDLASEGPATENLRLALRQYRSFFDRLISL